MPDLHDNEYNPDGNSILADELLHLNQFTEATMGQRCMNYIIDHIVMRYTITYLSKAVIGALIVNFLPEFALQLTVTGATFDFIVLFYLFFVFNYLVYYTFCEKVFKGYTLGKLITGTRAVRQDGEELTLRDAFLRSVCRLVPLEPFAALVGVVWHDKWTKTMVVKAR